MTGSPAAIATVMIVTKNRRDELRQAVATAVEQAGPVDVLVIDDGSTDGTSEMVRAEFPTARVISHGESRGLVARRNEGVAAAHTNIVVSIDDDALLSERDIVSSAVAGFERANVGAIAIPYINVNRDSTRHQLAPDGHDDYATDTFIGTAHALRRDVFLRLGGYRDLVHQGEETDYCIRMLAAGYAVKLGFSAPIHHLESPKRDLRRMDHYGPRNAILFAWQNVPLPFVMLQLPMTIAGVLLMTLRPRRLWTRVGGVADGVASCLRFERQPVPARAYRVWRRLRAAAPLRLEEVAAAIGSRG